MSDYWVRFAADMTDRGAWWMIACVALFIAGCELAAWGGRQR